MHFISRYMGKQWVIKCPSSLPGLINLHLIYKTQRHLDISLPAANRRYRKCFLAGPAAYKTSLPDATLILERLQLAGTTEISISARIDAETATCPDCACAHKCHVTIDFLSRGRTVSRQLCAPGTFRRPAVGN